MNNFINLCVNENSKIYKKTSTWIFLIILVFSVFACLEINYLIKQNNLVKEELKTNQRFARLEWKNINASIDYLEKSENVDEFELEKLKIEREYYEYAMEHEILLDSAMENNYYQYHIIKELMNLNITLLDDSLEDSTRINLNSDISSLTNMINENQYEQYIDYEINKINRNYEENRISKEEKNLLLSIKSLERKFEIGKYNDDAFRWKYTCMQKILEAKTELLNNTQIPEKERKALNNTIQIETYRLENNESVNDGLNNIANYKDSYLYLVELISILMIALFFIIISGTMIANEIADGTIKQTLMTPNKRWKILLAKITVLIINLIIITLVLSLLSQLIGNLFYKDSQFGKYLYVSNGNLHPMNGFVYSIVRFLSRDIEIIIYLLLTIMIALIANEPIIPVCLSLFLYFGNSIFMNFLNKIIQMEWIKYIPFNNFDVTSRLFSNTVNMPQTLFNYKENILVNSITFDFSICVTLLCIILITIITFLTFRKKAI
ncbi:MAG: ABC transporter permease subunit [Clostridia bacterium]|nr:ABC transporter permease subunit [Clostridia bacterium]